MKVYLAASMRRQAEMRGYREHLRLAGMFVTSRWLDVDLDGPLEEPEHYARNDLEDIREAEILVTFTETAAAGYLTGGRHIEVGYALCRPMPIFAVGDAENVFYHLTRLYGDWTSCLAAICGHAADMKRKLASR